MTRPSTREWGFGDGEPAAEGTVRQFRTTAVDGKSYDLAYYHLDMALALGLRVRSPVAMLSAST
jgi:hypothetical protein